MMCVRATPASVIDLNFKPLSWLRWMKLFAVIRNWSLSPMTFSISLPNVLSSTIGLNDLEESYNTLLGLDIMTVINLLKWEGQNPKLIQVLAMLIIFLKQSSSLRMTLGCLHNNLSSLGVEELLQLAMALLNSSLEKGAHEEGGLSVTLSRILMFTWQWRAVLNIKWSISHKTLMVKHSWSLYLITSMAGNLRLLT